MRRKGDVGRQKRKGYGLVIPADFHGRIVFSNHIIVFIPLYFMI